MLREIKLYGSLAKFVGHKTLKAEIASAAEAVRFLVANFPGLEQHMADQHYKVLVGDGALTIDELHYPSGQQQIKIVPVMAGAGGNVTTILAGVALVALSFVSFGAGTAFAGVAGSTLFGGAAAAGIGSTLLLGVGASLILGGVAGLLTPTPTITQPKVGKNSDSDPSKSYAFSGIQNTSRQGVPIPIIFGEVVTGSIVISAGIDIDEEIG